MNVKLEIELTHSEFMALARTNAAYESGASLTQLAAWASMMGWIAVMDHLARRDMLPQPASEQA